MTGNCSSDSEKSQVSIWDKNYFSEYFGGYYSNYVFL